MLKVWCNASSQFYVRISVHCAYIYITVCICIRALMQGSGSFFLDMQNMKPTESKLFNFFPLRCQSAKLRGFEMCFFHQQQTLRPNCYQLIHLLSPEREFELSQLGEGWELNYCVCGYGVKQDQRNTRSALEQIVNDHPRATTRASLLQICVDKGSEASFWQGVEAWRGGSLCC